MLWHQQQEQVQQQREQNKSCYYAILTLFSSHVSPINKTLHSITIQAFTTSME
jgi:hypothetical protein